MIYSEESVSVLILDDQLVQRQGIAQVVEETGVMQVVGLASRAEEAYAILQSRHVDLALVDLVLGRRTGTTVGRVLRQRKPELNVVIYTRENSMVLAADILREDKTLAQPGLQGYILTRNIKSSDYLRRVYETILQYGHYVDPDVLQWHCRLAEIEPLTAREKECALLLATGLSNKEIARQMVVSRGRVENLVGTLYLKFRIFGNPGDPGRRVLLAEGIRLLYRHLIFPRVRTVLVIEDEERRRAQLCGALSRDDRFQVVAKAATGKRGIELARKMRPDVVLVDVRLRDRDGFAVVRQICRECPQTRIIVNSSEASAIYQEEAHRAGAIRFIPKHRVSADEIFQICGSNG
ncbi:MAG: response regulator [Chloroflexota bacterium]